MEMDTIRDNAHRAAGRTRTACAGARATLRMNQAAMQANREPRPPAPAAHGVEGWRRRGRVITRKG